MENLKNHHNTHLSVSCFANLRQPILNHKFKGQDEKIVELSLYPNCVITTQLKHSSNNKSLNIFNFSANCFFQKIFKLTEKNQVKNGIRFVSGLRCQKQQKFFAISETVLLRWCDELSKHLNQRGFKSEYQLLELIGSGNSSKVYRGRNKKENVFYAIKIVERNLKNIKSQEAFLKEMHMMRSLNHPNILSIHAGFVQDDALYSVTQYYEQGTLFQEVTTKQSYTKEQQQKIIFQLTTAVQYLRSMKIVHRDIKLQNILVRKDKDEHTYVLADFGLASYINQKIKIFEACGTIGYTAPEVIRHLKDEHLELNCKMDTFSLGAIIHVILLRRTVFQCTQANIDQLVILNKKCFINWRQEFYKRMPKKQLELLQGMLAENPKNRLSTKQVLKLPYFSKFPKIDRKLSDISQKNSICSQSTKAENSFDSCHKSSYSKTVSLKNSVVQHKKKSNWNILNWFRGPNSFNKQSQHEDKSLEKCYIQETNQKKQRFFQEY